MSLSLAMKTVLLLSLVTLPFMASVSSAVRMDAAKGLVDLVIKVDESVHEQQCSDILANMEWLLSETSTSLSDAVNDARARFVSALLVVPRKWRGAACNGQLIGHPDARRPFGTADIVLFNNSLEERKELSTAIVVDPPTRCGQGSERMSFDVNVLLNASSTASSSLSSWFAWSFLKMRYGVYDEIGRPGHPLFPDRVYEAGRMHPVLTSNTGEMRGKWMRSEGQECVDTGHSLDCVFVASEEQKEEATCSMASALFYPQLKGARRLCSTDEIVVDVPSMHNVLCEGKAVLDVIKSHGDFKVGAESTSGSVTPLIHVVRDPPLHLVLVLDISASRMDVLDEWKWIAKALQKFIRLDVAADARLALIVTAGGNKSSLIQASMILDQARSLTRARLADLIPDRFHLDDNRQPLVVCLECLINLVLENVSNENVHLVLVTSANQSGEGQRVSVVSEQRLLDVVRRQRLKVSAVLLSRASTRVESGPFSALVDVLAMKSGGWSSLITIGSNNLKTYLSVNKALAKVAENDRERVYESLIRTELGYTTTGFFTLPFSSSNTRFGVVVANPEDHLIRAISFTDDRGRRHGPYRSLSSIDDVVNLKRINLFNDNLDIFDGKDDDEAKTKGRLATWQYAIEWYPGRGEGVVIVDTQLNPRVRVERVWTNKKDRDGGDVVRDSDDLLTIFANVLNHDHLEDVEVVANVHFVPADNAADTHTFAIQLQDNGDTAPDILAGDGVYSGRLLHYPSAGRYSFRVQLSVSGGSVLSSKDGPVLHLVHVPSNVDPRPLRILDLTLTSQVSSKVEEKDKEKLLYTAKWTAIRSDLVAYHIYTASRLMSLLSEKEDEWQLVARFPVGENEASGRRGDVISKDVVLKTDHQYVGIVGVSSMGQKSPMSNVVHLEYLAAMDAAARQVVVMTKEGPGAMLVIIIAFFLVAAAILWASIWWITRTKLRRLKTRGNNASLKNNDNDNEEEEANNVADANLVPQFSALASGGGPIGFYPNTPVHWTASQLLDHKPGTVNRVPKSSDKTKKHHYVNLTFPRRITITQNDDCESLKTVQECPLLIDRSTSPMEKIPPNLAALYGTVRRVQSNRVSPPTVPPRPSIDALLGVERNKRSVSHV